MRPTRPQPIRLSNRYDPFADREGTSTPEKASAEDADERSSRIHQDELRDAYDLANNLAWEKIELSTENDKLARLLGEAHEEIAKLERKISNVINAIDERPFEEEGD